jgi:hypothetical protein
VLLVGPSKLLVSRENGREHLERRRTQSKAMLFLTVVKGAMVTAMILQLGTGLSQGCPRKANFVEVFGSSHLFLKK